MESFGRPRYRRKYIALASEYVYIIIKKCVDNTIRQMLKVKDTV